MESYIRIRPFFLCICLAVLLQLSFLNIFSISGVKPNFILIFVIIAALNFEISISIVFGIFAGLLKDIFITDLPGINIFLFALWVLLINRLSRKIFIDNNVTCMILVFSVALLNGIALNLIYLFLAKPLPVGIFLRISFLESIYTALFFPLVFKITKPFIYNQR